MERLDYILLSGSLTNEIVSSGIEPAFMSDHSIPHVTFSCPDNTGKGPGYWKLNIKYLQNPEYLELVREVIKDCQDNVEGSKLRWEMIKMKVRGESVKFGSRKKRSDTNKLVALDNKLYQIIAQRDKTAVNNVEIFQDHERQIALIEKDIENIIHNRTIASGFANQVNWFLDGEKVTRGFFSLEKGKEKKPISRLKVGDEIIEQQSLILEKIRFFYDKLFSSQAGDARDYGFLEGLDLRKIDQEDRDILDSPISLEEIKIAVNQLHIDKYLGLDGFPIEFYQVFWPELKNTLHSLYMTVVEDEMFHRSARQGAISLLEKLGKDQLLVESWRPLSLLGSDFKIFTKILANRLSLVMHYIINADQSGFMKNR